MGKERVRMKDEAVLTVDELVRYFRGKGVSLWREEGKLKYRAPQGMMSDEDLNILRSRKNEILQWLKSESASVQYTVAKYPKERFHPFPLTDVQSAYLLGRNEAFGYGESLVIFIWNWNTRIWSGNEPRKCGIN